MKTVFEIAKALDGKFQKLGVSFSERYKYNHEFCGCPFDSAAIDFSGRSILFDKHTTPSTLIHELGHLLFGISKKYSGPDNYPGISGIYWLEEFQWHGWEMFIAEELDFFEQFLVENGDYVVDFKELSMLTKSELRAYISQAKKVSTENLSSCFR